MTRLFVVAGEASGDTHAAGVLRELLLLRPDMEIAGLGGPKMRALAPGVDDWIHDAAVVGLWDVIRRYGWFRSRFRETLDRIAAFRPDAVVFVDYPGFNLRLARALHARPDRPRLVYYISPQVWAWNRGRIPRMARWLDRMLCIFPFEKPLYEASGLRTEFVGHPMAAHLSGGETPARDADLLCLLPGSRQREVRKIFPVMLEAARRVLRRRPATRLAAAAASEPLRAAMEAMVRAAGMPCAVGLRNAHELMRTAAAGMVASGTATLEATFLGLPYLLVYRVPWLTYVAGRLLIRVDHLGMANILAGRPVVREFIQHEARPEPMAAETLRLLDDAGARAAMQHAFVALTADLAATDASRRAAKAILEALGGGASSL